jgi:hypothetical protein
VHSSRDLATTTPLTMRHDAVATLDGDDNLLGRSPEHAETGQWTAPLEADDEPDELSPGPSDVNGG